MHILRVPLSRFALRWWDLPKETAQLPNYCSGGFFAVYRTEDGQGTFTLPVANLTADIPDELPGEVRQALADRGAETGGGKLRLPCPKKWGGDPFRDRQVSTIVVENGRAHIVITPAPPAGADYALSGVPVIIGGREASWSRDARPQGWSADCARAAWHGVLGLPKDGDGHIVLAAVRTATYNCIVTSELWRLLLPLNLRDAILIDGGGSFVLQVAGVARAKTPENRRINNLIVF
jgi:hypothetical protein